MTQYELINPWYIGTIVVFFAVLIIVLVFTIRKLRKSLVLFTPGELPDTEVINCLLRLTFLLNTSVKSTPEGELRLQIERSIYNSYQFKSFLYNAQTVGYKIDSVTLGDDYCIIIKWKVNASSETKE